MRPGVRAERTVRLQQEEEEENDDDDNNNDIDF